MNRILPFLALLLYTFFTVASFIPSSMKPEEAATEWLSRTLLAEDADGQESQKNEKTSSDHHSHPPLILAQILSFSQIASFTSHLIACFHAHPYGEINTPPPEIATAC